MWDINYHPEESQESRVSIYCGILNNKSIDVFIEELSQEPELLQFQSFLQMSNAIHCSFTFTATRLQYSTVEELSWWAGVSCSSFSLDWPWLSLRFSLSLFLCFPPSAFLPVLPTYFLTASLERAGVEREIWDGGSRKRKKKKKTSCSRKLSLSLLFRTVIMENGYVFSSYYFLIWNLE